MKMKKALVLGSGGLYGAYSAGFVSELCRRLGNEYFDSVYCYSVGTTIGTFYVANQPGIIEKTWKEHIHGKKLVKSHNLFTKKPMLDLDYLTSLFKDSRAYLDVNSVMNSKVDLNYVLIDYYSGEVYCMKPNKKNIFELIKAACSVPIVSGPTKVGNKKLFDVAFVHGGLPLLEEIAQKHDEVVVVMNFPRGYKPKIKWWPIINLFFPVASYFYPKGLRKVFQKRKGKLDYVFDYAEKNNKIKIITPSEPLTLKSTGDSNKHGIHALFDLGKKDAKAFINNL